MKTKHKQEHNHSEDQLALDGIVQTKAVARRSDPATSHTAAESQAGKFRASHRRVLQLFRRFGAMSDEDALEAARADGWLVSPSGLRSRRAELTPPRGRGIRNSGRLAKLPSGRSATIWEIDE